MALLDPTVLGRKLTLVEMQNQFTFLLGLINNLSVTAGGEAERTFTSALLFDVKLQHVAYTQSTTDIAFTLNPTGNLDNALITMELDPSPSQGVTFSSDFLTEGQVDNTQINILSFYHSSAKTPVLVGIKNIPRIGSYVSPTAATLATPTNVQAISTTAGALTVSLTAVAGAGSYAYQLSTTSTFTAVSNSLSSSNTSALFSGLPAGTYYARVSASASGANTSGFGFAVGGVTVSAAATTPTSSTPTLKTPATITAVISVAGTIKVSWGATDQPNATYTLMRGGTVINSGSNSTTYTDTLDTSLSYTYSVYASLAGYQNSGTVTTVSEHVAKYQFDGALQTVTLANQPGVAFLAGTPFTFGGYFSPGGGRVIVSRSSFDTSVRAWDLVYSSGSFGFQLNDATGNTIFYYPTNGIGQLGGKHIVCQYDGTTSDTAFTITASGVAIAMNAPIRSGVFTSIPAGGVTTLGQVTGAASSGSTIDDFFFSSPLTAADIASFYNADGTINQNPMLLALSPKIIAYYDFNGTLNDATGQHNGTATTPHYV